MKIIHKYVLREHAGPLVFAVSALTSLLLLNYIAKQFGNLVGKGLPWSVILEFFGLSVPFTVAMTFPMAVLVATLYAFSRLAAENEITALKASGVSLVKLLYPVLVAAAFLSLLMIYFNDQVLPKANHQLRTLQGDIARKKPTFALKEQVINEVSPGKLFLRANHLDEFSNRMQEVTIYDLSDPLRRRTIYADSGTMAVAPNGSDLVLTLYDGNMIEVPKEKPLQLKRLFYKIDHVRAVDVMNAFSQTTDDSYKSDREMSICELQSEVSRSELEYDRARTDLRRALIGAAREAVTGAPPVLPPDTSSPPQANGKPAPRSRRASLGRVYCDAQERLAALTDRFSSRRLAWVVAPAVAYARESNAGARETSRSAIGDRELVAQDTTRAKQDTAKRDTTKKDTTRKDTTRKDSTKQDTTKKPLPANLPVKRPSIVPDPGMPPNINPQLPIDSTPQKRDSAATLPGGVRPVPPAAQPRVQPNDTANLFPATARPGLPTPGARIGPSPSYPSQPFIISAAVDGAKSRMVESERMANQNAVELHKKFAISVACFVFVLIGAPIALRFPRAGVGLVIGVSLGVFALYYVGLIGGEALADRGFLPPALAMWSTNILLTMIGLALLSRIGAEGATARGGDVGEMLELFRNAFARFSRKRVRRADSSRPALPPPPPPPPSPPAAAATPEPTT